MLEKNLQALGGSPRNLRVSAALRLAGFATTAHRGARLRSAVTTST